MSQSYPLSMTPSCDRKYDIRVKMENSDKHTRLLQNGMDYHRQMFYHTAPRGVV
jgi:hypothetical protein